jgi:hypothetical protein
MMPVDFLYMLQGCSLATLRDIRSSVFMVPMSIGYTWHVELGNRNSNLIFIKESERGFAAHLSRASRIFLDCRCNCMSQLISHFLKVFDIIHAFLLAEYRTGKLSILIPLKHRDVALFPITRSFRLSVPDMLEQHNAVNDPLLCLNQIEMHACSLENRSARHVKKINLFHRHCKVDSFGFQLFST